MTPTEVLLRPAEQDDLDELLSLLQVTRREAEPLMPALARSPVEVREFLGSRIALGEVWVAVDEVLVGFVLVTDDWLHSMYVGPAHQGLGIGTLLLDLVKSLCPNGFGLWVFASNTPARGFYARHGLIELEHTDGTANEERSPDVRMVWAGQQPVAGLRRWIDEVDDDLALLLARRFALTAAVQAEKQRLGTPSGHHGRDPEREREIVARMTRHSPGLEVERVARVMSVVISESIEQWAERA